MGKTFLSILFSMLMVANAHAGGFSTLAPDNFFKYSSSSGPSVKTVKSTAGFLHTLTVTGGTTSPIDIYDSAISGGTSIASYTTTNTAQTYYFDVSFSSGCTVVTNGGLKYEVSYL